MNLYAVTYRTLIVLLFAVLTPPVKAQSIIDSLIATVADNAAKHPEELIYIQTSKGIYETGEDLWFKAYLLDARSFSLTDTTRTLYIQMMGEADNKIVWQNIYPVEGGTTAGHIYIDEGIPEGNYSIEAYTGRSFFADSTEITAVRKIRIQKNAGRNEKAGQPADAGFRFETFPEGGNLVAGIPSRLAFKATDGKGNPMEATGTLYENDKALAALESVHDGMGVLEFTPQGDKKYRISLNNGKQCDLPPIYDKGVVLHLAERDDENLTFRVAQSNGMPPRTVYLMGQTRGMVCCVAKGVVQENLRIKMPLAEFPLQGIAEFTLFDSDGTPLCERLVYLHPQQRLHISMEMDKKGYMTREKASLKIKVTDENGIPVRAHLGVSVYDALYENPVDGVNIMTHCLLSTQIKGGIHNPAYYFDAGNEKRGEHLDLLLLTQGWRRYVWNNGNSPNKRAEILKDEITGNQRLKNKKVKNSNQLIQITGANGISELIWADASGHFILDIELMKKLQGGYLYLKPMTSKEYHPKLTIEDPFKIINDARAVKQRLYSFIDPNHIKTEDLSQKPIVGLDSAIMLNEISITKKAKKPFRDKFMGHLDSLMQRETSVWVCMHGYLENYRVGYSHLVGDPQSAVQCAQYFRDTLNIRRKPVRGEQYGVIKYERDNNGRYRLTDQYDITYNDPLYSDEELLEMNNIRRIKGYYGKREFYEPDQADMQQTLPDARNTLLWNPDIITDEKGEASVTFFCSDVNTLFKGKIEGVGGLGMLGVQECEFRIMRKPAP